MIKEYKIWRIQLPMGRTIGDNMCHYDHFHVCVVKLTDADGTEAWGYGEKVAEGFFQKPVPWQAKMPPVAAIQHEFIDRYWKGFQSAHSVDELLTAPGLKGDHYLKNALRFALWDLKGKQAGLPLYKILNPHATQNGLRSYASGLGFHQPTDWLLDFYQKKVQQGFKMIKVKVGHPNPEWDLKRLRKLREVLGETVEISIDANIAWDAPITIERIAFFQKNGINLSYVEDPIPPDDLEGYRLLAHELPIKIAGHDYISDPEALKPLLDTGALSYLRIRDGVDYGIRAAALAEEYGAALIHCNTFMEWGLHAGLGNPRVDRIEFADLGWNALAQKPFSVENGIMCVHEVPGHGLEPKTELLEKWKI